MIRRLFILAWIPLLLSCEETRVQYRKTPAFYGRMADVQGLEGGQTRDGTEIRFVQRESNTLEGFKDHTGKAFYMREVRSDGSTALNALAPEHVLFNTLDCLANQEYELIWDEMISESTRAWYDGEESGGKDACLEFFRVNRKEISAMLNRMKGGMHLGEVVARAGAGAAATAVDTPDRPPVRLHRAGHAVGERQVRPGHDPLK